MKIITAAIIKGGTGKTTTCAALAQAAAANRKKVLAIDLDPQANFTSALDGDINQAGSYELLTGTPAADVIQKTSQNIFLIAGSSDLAEIHTKAGSAKRLKEAIDPITENFDLVIIDTPPTTGELQNNALTAATDLIIPLEADTDSLQGLYKIADIAEHVKNTNKKLNVAGVLITRYDGRSKLNKYYREVIRDKAAELQIPYLTEIRQGIAIKEARAMQTSLYSYSPNSKPAADYRELYKMINRRVKK